MYVAAASSVDTLSDLCGTFASYTLILERRHYVQQLANVIYTFVDRLYAFLLRLVVTHSLELCPVCSLFSISCHQ